MLRILQRKLGIEHAHKSINQHRDEISQLKTHILNLEQNIQSISRSSPHAKITTLSQKIKEIEQWNMKVYDLITKDRETVAKYFETFNNRFEEQEEVLQSLKQPLKAPSIVSTNRELGLTLEHPTQKIEQDASGAWSQDPISEGNLLWEKTSDAEKEIIRELYDAGYPMSYQEISSRLNKSVSTVKNQINNLKLKGFHFEESISLNNLKKYLLDNRVKLFLTMRLSN